MPKRLLVRTWVVALLAGCAERPGVLIGPQGTERLRTATYVETEIDQTPALVVLLSNDVVPCSIPPVGSEPSAYASLLVAACREDARHAVLILRDLEARWAGRFVGSAEGPGASGSYAAVLESSLFEVNGLDRGYLIDEVQLLELGDGGQAELALEDGFAAGWFDFPAEGVSAEFRATRCAADPSPATLPALNPVAYCQAL